MIMNMNVMILNLPDAKTTSNGHQFRHTHTHTHNLKGINQNQIKQLAVFDLIFAAV